MNSDRDFESTAAEWLNAGSDATPPHVIDTVLLAARSTPQERDYRIPLRTTSMTFFMRVAAAIAVVGLTGVAALYAFGWGPNVGSGATPEPTTQPTLTQPPTPSPSVTSRTFSANCSVLEAGTHRASAGTLPVTFTVPNGWHGAGPGFHVGRGDCVLDRIWVEISLVSRVPTDACHWGGAYVAGETSEAVTAALAAQEGHESTGPTDVTLAGHPASRFEFSLPVDFDEATCTDGSVTLWQSPGNSGGQDIGPGGQIITVYVVDIDGSTVAVAATHFEDDDTLAALPELEAVVDSLRFEP